MSEYVSWVDCNHSYDALANHSGGFLCDHHWMMETIGARILRIRKQQGLSQQQVADHLRVSRVAVSKWETGASQNLKHDNLIGLADLFGMSIAALLQGTDQTDVRANSGPASAPELPATGALSEKQRLLLEMSSGMSDGDMTTLLRVGHALKKSRTVNEQNGTDG